MYDTDVIVQLAPTVVAQVSFCDSASNMLQLPRILGSVVLSLRSCELTGQYYLPLPGIPMRDFVMFQGFSLQHVGECELLFWSDGILSASISVEVSNFYETDASSWYSSSMGFSTVPLLLIASLLPRSSFSSSSLVITPYDSYSGLVFAAPAAFYEITSLRSLLLGAPLSSAQAVASAIQNNRRARFLSVRSGSQSVAPSLCAVIFRCHLQYYRHGPNAALHNPTFDICTP